MDRHRLDMEARRRGFTLIELLIVVAIIAILAAIAVPNFLEAQTRSKVSRCRADMRSVAVAFEAYYVDHNSYSRYNNVFLKETTPGVVDYTNAPGYSLLSTPIAYISNSMPIDPFIHRGGNSTNPFVETIKKTYEWTFAGNDGTQLPAQKTQFLMQGFGPDGFDQLGGLGNWAREVNGMPTMPEFSGGTGKLIYDPTNGTVSAGDIYRVQGKAAIMAHYGNNGS